jgi:hypothetical protein
VIVSTEAQCPGCGLTMPDVDGPTHPYVGSSSACWALYGEVLAREYGELGYPECHRLTVDAYAVQHPGRRERTSIQSVGLHLCGLYLVLERNLDGPRATALKNSVLASNPRFVWLRPPVPNGEVTVRDVFESKAPQAHCGVVETWARSVWDAWKLHHETVRQWVEPALTGRDSLQQTER